MWFLVPMLAGAAATGLASTYTYFNSDKGESATNPKDYLGSQTGAMATIQIVSVAAVGVVGIVALMRTFRG